MSKKTKFVRRKRNAIILVFLIVLVIVLCFVFMFIGIATRGKKTSATVPTAEPTATEETEILYTPVPEDVTTASAVVASATPTAAEGVKMYVTGDGVNVRKQASASSDKVTSLAQGTAVTALKQEGDFWQIKLADGTVGYISAKYVSTSASATSAATASATAASTPDTSNGTTMYVTGDSVNVRKTASSDGERITRVSKGTKVTAYTTSNGWTYVMYSSGKYGYISASLLSSSVPATATPTAAPTSAATATPTAEHATSFSSIGVPEAIADQISGKESLLSMTKVQSVGSAKSITLNEGTEDEVKVKYYRVSKLDGGSYYIAFKEDGGSYTGVKIISDLGSY